MDNVSLTDAKAHLSKLIERASKGETFQITRRGVPVAKLIGVEKPKKPIDIELLRSVSRKSKMQMESAGDFIRRMRDDSRY
jgi:prevent-host-death family protein